MDLSKRYWIFVGNNYYPKGGMLDFSMSCDTISEAKMYLKGQEHALDGWGMNWYHIFDSKNPSAPVLTEWDES